MLVVFVLIMTVLIRVYVDTDECPDLLQQVDDHMIHCGFTRKEHLDKCSAFAFTKFENSRLDNGRTHEILAALDDLKVFFKWLDEDCEYDNSLICIDSIKEL